ncbi:hypothetical protein CVT26_006138 [Gymnopilus dilepis]|uniref:Uncharacterized protein n=1 Tax=Gymnopilus dilepis TaxID=231916 RepID=A0A409YKN1_9AGAR|nr:hypothetical protein CVT26_006138 [Gymnopilus dilepis]
MRLVSLYTALTSPPSVQHSQPASTSSTRPQNRGVAPQARALHLPTTTRPLPSSQTIGAQRAHLPAQTKSPSTWRSRKAVGGCVERACDLGGDACALRLRLHLRRPSFRAPGDRGKRLVVAGRPTTSEWVPVPAQTKTPSSGRSRKALGQRGAGLQPRSGCLRQADQDAKQLEIEEGG